MRGKLDSSTAAVLQLGITPAYAGKTRLNPRRFKKSKDHPRVCGENFLPCLHRGYRTGSPPRMRGKPCCAFVTASRSRITPAYAGKTLTRLHCRCQDRDHPRVCGENRLRNGAENGARGSPPRMRGKLHSPYISPPRLRITPADAGKTLLPTGRRNAGQDHPRGCGENR